MPPKSDRAIRFKVPILWCFLVFIAYLAATLTVPAQNTNPAAAPAGMVLIPAGGFLMGDTRDGERDAIPVTFVMLSPFYMDANLITCAQWQAVHDWATGHGYGFEHPGLGKAPDHPVQTINWYDAIKWCNARSQRESLAPAYYTDAALTQLYTNGSVDAVFVNWTAAGYRLPTEAEWEKAARGGRGGLRFPWGNTISQKQANYDSKTSYKYDLGPDGYNAAFNRDKKPYTSPVSHFAPNDYGLYDMAGNVTEWCWDWYGTPYAGGTDPHGPASPSGGISGHSRVTRGGDWDYFAYLATCAHRGYFDPSFAVNTIGFRCVRVR